MYLVKLNGELFGTKSVTKCIIETWEYTKLKNIGRIRRWEKMWLILRSFARQQPVFYRYLDLNKILLEFTTTRHNKWEILIVKRKLKHLSYHQVSIKYLLFHSPCYIWSRLQVSETFKSKTYLVTCRFLELATKSKEN